MQLFFRILNELEEREADDNPPKKQLLRFAMFLIIALFFLICFTYSVFSFVTMFFLVFWILIYNRFVKIWAAYRYSKLLLHSIVLVVAVTSVLSGEKVRQFLASLINFIIYR